MATHRAIEPGDRVCVTGASGYIGSHVVDALLREGYRVRATVRDASATDKVAHLHELARAHAGDLEVVSADLTRAGAFDDAVADCPGVCHVASSVRLRATDPQRDIVDVAVQGTKNVLASIDAAAAARRVVITSSVAAVVDEDKPLTHVFDESDWNESSTLDHSPYPLSKVLAEREAWKHLERAGEPAPYDIVTINPTLVLGPILTAAHARSSPTVLRDMLSGKFPAVPDLRFQVVDVRDVALAHVRALQREDASGRHIVNHCGAALTEMAAMLRAAFPERRTPKYRMPNLLMYGVALYDKRLTFGFLKRHLSVVRRLNAEKSREALGLVYRPVNATVRDTGRSFIELGVV